MSKLGMKTIRIVCLIILVIAAVTSTGYIYTIKNEEAKLKNEVKSCVSESVGSVDGDKFESIVKNGLGNGTEYSDILNSMLSFKARNAIKNFYTYAKQDDKTALFVVDTSPNPSGFREKYNMKKEMLEAFKGNITVTKNSYRGKEGDFISAYAPIKNSSGQVVGIIGADKDVSIFQDLRDMYLMILIVAIGLAIVISLVFVMLFSQKLKKHIILLEDNLNKMGDGDLTNNISIKSKDEIESIGQLVNTFRIKIGSSLNNISANVEEVNKESENLSVISNDMAASAQNLSQIIQGVAQSSSSQTMEIININTTFNDFGRNVEQIAELMDNFDKRAKAIKTKSEKGSVNIDLLQNTIVDLNGHFKIVTDKIIELSSSIIKISDITNLINSIAEQTNLLALNAAIEAARAGESGKGFSVVAEEIRKLAEQSKISSNNINELIKNISVESDEVVGKSKNVNSQMLEQTKIVNDVAISLKNIIKDIEDLLPEIHSVNNSVIEVNDKKTDIISSLETLSSAAEEVSASSEEFASLTEVLSNSTGNVSGAANKLSQMVNEVKCDISKFKTA